MPANPVPVEVMMARSHNGKTLGGRDLDVVDVSQLEKLQPPEPPEGLGARGLEEWHKIWAAGRWLWPDQDYAWVEQAARAYDDIAAFRAQVEEMGLTVQGYNGQTVANPLISEIRKAEDTIRRCLSMLGFSPSDRARLRLTDLKSAKAAKDLMPDGAASGNTQAGAQAPVAQGYVEDSW